MIQQVAEITPTFVTVMMIANYFQSIGDVSRSALLSLSRTYLFAVPLIFLLPLAVGEIGIWLALPVADASLVAVTLMVLKARSAQAEWGLFQVVRQHPRLLPSRGGAVH
ncbi:hypothetical protein IVA80_16875 [Bradyrhizobium sp. 139]|uniref:hypothetical protein n=1 Tax=Bradyrhizobium sp. 139 TaxID=2782616 RepID=UPI001FF9F1DE|nr:hypothetical protein [Bradyrhizobium sp. 139]MCK1742492.1 hypothetical protein [Bradyrhizobium sp. 139]